MTFTECSTSDLSNTEFSTSVYHQNHKINCRLPRNIACQYYHSQTLPSSMSSPMPNPLPSPTPNPMLSPSLKIWYCVCTLYNNVRTQYSNYTKNYLFNYSIQCILFHYVFIFIIYIRVKFLSFKLCTLKKTRCIKYYLKLYLYFKHLQY